MPTTSFHRSAGALLAGLSLLLGGCNGSGGSDAPATTTVSGTAAVGAPLVAASVDLHCRGGATATVMTDTNGAWSVSVASSQLPCAVRASGGLVDGSPNLQTLYSLTVGSDSTVVANVTPLTTLAMADALNVVPDDAWFSSLDAAALQTLAGNLGVAVDALVDALQTLGYALPAEDFDPFTLAFVPESGNAYDDLLEQLKTVLSANGASLDTVTAQVASGTLTVDTGGSVGLENVHLGGDGSGGIYSFFNNGSVITITGH